jgi:hypothetical protein
VDKRSKDGLARHWYKISEDTIRGCGMIVLGAAILLAAVFGYRAVRPYLDRQDAARIIQEDRGLIRRIELEETVGSFDRELLTARDNLQSAEIYYADGEYRKALNHARRSRSILTWIADALLHHRLAGEAQFISVKGRVEYRRGNRGQWKTAAGRDVLRSGDFVKTSGSGLAEIIFDDGTLYTVRPNTLFVVTRSNSASEEDDERAIAMEYGWVNLNTSQRGSKVETPGAEARLGRQSEGLVAYDQETDTGRFATYRGSMEVSSGAAQRDVRALQEVTLKAERLSQPKRLPGRPYLLAPEDNFEVTLGSRDRVVLRWSPVEDAARYALQVSRSRLFVDNIVDVDDRTDTRVSVGLRGEGTFVWRVAAYNKDGRQGPWSTMQRFRVAASGSSGPGRVETLSGPEVEETELSPEQVGAGDR